MLFRGWLWARRRFFPTRLDRIRTIDGWLFDSQMEFLTRCVRKLPQESRIVGIGVWKGKSTLTMAEACRGTHKKVYAVDPWVDYEQGGSNVGQRLGEWGVNSFEEVYDSCRKNCQDLQLETWIKVRRSTSREAAKSWSEGPVAMVFVDGGHDYEAGMDDLQSWVPLMRPRGIVCGDDWNWESVSGAVKDFVNRAEYWLEFPCENTWLFRV